MTSSKLRMAAGFTLVAAISCCTWVSQALPVWSQEQAQQAQTEGDQQAAPDQAAPAEGTGGDTAAPAAAEPSADGSAAAPSPEPSQAPAGDAAAPPADNSGAAQSPAQPEQPAAESAPAEGAAAVSASQIQIGTAVFGSDGAKIGEVNGVKSDDAGKVQEILVTDGVPAGMNAKVFAITADKITSVGDGVKLSLSSEEAKKLPIIDNSNG